MLRHRNSVGRPASEKLLCTPARFFSVSAEEEDTDVKIFAGSGAVRVQPTEDDGAAEFVRERENGNIDKAKQLGKMLARRLRWLRCFGDSSPILDQKKVLFSYVAVKVIGRQVQSSLLGQAALGEFYRSVQNHSQRDYDKIQDSVAFTKYLLSEQKAAKNAIGGVFAELCGQRENDALQNKGMQLYYRYTSDCMSICNQIHFQ